MKCQISIAFVCFTTLSACLPSDSGRGGAEATGDAPAQVIYPSKTIAQVQGKGDISPLLGQSVRVRGVVSANFVGGLNGFFLQSEIPDRHRATSDAIFVQHDRSQEPRIRLGELVEITGVVAELGDVASSLTALEPIAMNSIGQAPLPNPVLLSTAPVRVESWESLEGMRVAIQSPLTISGTHNLRRFGELVVSFDGRLFVPTDIVEPGVEARRLAKENERRRIIIDDARNAQNPKKIWYLPTAIDAENPYRTGTVIEQVQGIIDQRHGYYRLQLTDAPGKFTQAERPSAPPRTPSTLRLMSLNLLNLFNGDGRGGGFPTERGAADAQEYQRQLDKHVEVVSLLDPDIMAVQEIENDYDQESSAQDDLLAALNKGVRGNVWTGLSVPSKPGNDSIAVAMIFRKDRVSTQGNAGLLLGGVFDGKSRPPIAQSFRSKKGVVFTVAANHFKSKGSCADAQGPDQDKNDGQSCFNASRLESAQRLSEWLASDPTRSGSDLRIIMGDLNAYAMEDPLQWLKQHGWRDAFSVTSDVYSYVFNAEAGRLDHVLLSHSAHKYLVGAYKWHINADELSDFEYSNSTQPGPWRSSDHDPLVVDLQL